MNKQRKVLITITNNEMGIIVDTKAEEVAQGAKRGRWINKIDTRSPMYECSLCKCRVSADEYTRAVGFRGFSYCPYCGVEMENLP